MFFQSVAVSFNVNDPAMMEEPIQDGGGDDGIAEEFLPIGKAFVRCDNSGAFLIAIGDELEKEISFTAVHGEIAHLIHNNQGRVEIGFTPGLGFLQFADQGIHGGEINLESVAAGLDRQRDGQMGFPHPGRAQEDDILMLGDKGQIEELHDRFFIQLRMKGEVILLDGFCGGQPGRFHGGADPPLFLGGHLFFQKVVKEGKIGTAVIL